MENFHDIVEKLKQFNVERDWDKNHNSKDVLLALIAEVGELAECYTWLSQEGVTKLLSDPVKKKNIEKEMADVMIYLLILAYKSDVDLLKAVNEKIEINKQRYPLEKSKGVTSNFIEGYKASS